MTFYHFTHLGHVPRILADGHLRPTESNVGAPVQAGFGKHVKPVGERVRADVVWLLDEAEPFIGEDNERAHGLYPAKRQIRFEVDVPAVRWIGSSWHRKMHREWRDLFVQAAGGPEVAEHWYVYPARIAVAQWVAITDMNTGERIERPA